MLRERETEMQYLQEIVESTPDLVGTAAPDGTFIYFNRAGRDLLGLSADDDITEHSVREIHPPGLFEKMLAEVIPEVIKSGEWRGESSLMDKDGKIFPISQVILAHKSSTGEVEFISSIMRDIAELRQAQLELREKEGAFLQMIERSPIGFFRTTFDGQIIMSNPATLNMTGFDSVEEMNAMGLANLYVRPQDREEFLGRAKAGPVAAFETQVKRRDGSFLDISLSAEVVRDKDGRPPFLEGTITDISERRRAEDALRESEDFAHNIVAASPMGIHMYELEGEGRLVFAGANPTADQLLGVDNSQFIGKTIEEAFPPLVETEVPQRYRDAARKGVPWMTEQIQYQDHQIQGAFEVYAFQTSPDHMAALFLEVTSRKKQEAALRQLLGDKEILIRDIHHRVKNNMAMIINLMMLEMGRLEELHGSDTPGLEALEKCRDRIFILAEIYSLLYQPDQTVETVDCRDFFARLLALIRGLFPAELDITLDISIDEIALSIQRLVPLGVMVNEIASNSLKYAFSGVSEGQLAFAMKRCEDGKILLTMEDNGPGIQGDIEMLKKNSLGLKLIEGFVRQVDGDLDLQTDNGVRYSIVFPE